MSRSLAEIRDELQRRRDVLIRDSYDASVSMDSLERGVKA